MKKKNIVSKRVEFASYIKYMAEWKADNKRGWKCVSSGYDGKAYWRIMEK